MPSRVKSPVRYRSRSRVRSKSASRKFSVAKVLAPYKDCPDGMIKRKAYTRKAYTRADGTKVAGTKVASECIKDRGFRSRLFQLRTGSMGIGKLKRGELSKFGYSVNASEAVRHKALRDASEKYSSLSVLRKLNALSVYDKRVNPEYSEIFKEDRDYVRKIHEREKSKSKSK